MQATFLNLSKVLYTYRAEHTLPAASVSASLKKSNNAKKKLKPVKRFSIGGRQSLLLFLNIL